MAPNGEILSTPYSRSDQFMITKPQKLSKDGGLQRAVSDLSFQLMSTEILIDDDTPTTPLPPISEVEDAKCECCGMSEECTPEYIRRVRDKFSGKWICGLCSEAVKEEMEKHGSRHEEALGEHMSACVRFNRFGRTHPVLYQAEAMREMFRKNSRGPRAKSTSPRDQVMKKGSIARSSSCIPAITKEFNERTAVN